MQLTVLFHALNRHDFLVAGLDGEHGARFHRSAVHEDGAGAAVGRVAPDMGAGHPQHVPDQVDQQEARLNVSLVLLAVDRELDPHRPHLSSPARSRALRSARAVNTRTRSRLYSTDPRRSSLGWAASAASWAARLIVASSAAVLPASLMPCPAAMIVRLAAVKVPVTVPACGLGRCSNALSNVGFNRSLEAGIARRVRDRAAILADFPSEPTAGAGGDRPRRRPRPPE